MYQAPKYECCDCGFEKIVYDFYQSKSGKPSKRCRECQRALNKLHPSESERLRKCAPEPHYYLGAKRARHRPPKKPEQGYTADGSSYQF